MRYLILAILLLLLTTGAIFVVFFLANPTSVAWGAVIWVSVVGYLLSYTMYKEWKTQRTS